MGLSDSEGRMNQRSNFDYFAARVAEERRRSESSTNLRVARVHRELAERYEALLAKLRPRPELEIIDGGSSRAA